MTRRKFSWRRKRPEAVGFTTTVNSGRDKAGHARLHTVCGLLMHSSLAVTTDGLPLRMAAVKFWNRKKFMHGSAQEKGQAGYHSSRESESSYTTWWDTTRQPELLHHVPGTQPMWEFQRFHRRPGTPKWFRSGIEQPDVWKFGTPLISHPLLSK